MKPHILILTASAGGGHIAAAKAIEQALNKEYGDKVEVRLTDGFTDPEFKLFIPIDKVAIPGYAKSVKLAKAYPYKLLYDFANVTPELVNKFFTSVFRDTGRRYLEKYKPDVIITTFPVMSTVAHRLIKEMGLDIPIITLITDAGGIHKLWLTCPEDEILVASADTIEHAVKAGVPRRRLHYLGFPVSEEFYDLPPKAAARKRLGLEDKPTVYISAGGLGLSTVLEKIAARLAPQSLDAQYLIVAGRNSKLEERLRKLEFVDDARIFGFVDNVPDLLAASDFYVGKAGWLSLSEAMAAGKPIIITNVVPGQEEANAKFVESHGIGRVILRPRMAAEAIAEYLRHPERLQILSDNYRHLELKRDSGKQIARFIVSKLPVKIT